MSPPKLNDLKLPDIPVKYCLQSVGALKLLSHSKNVALMLHVRPVLRVPVVAIVTVPAGFSLAVSKYICVPVSDPHSGVR